MTHANKKIPNTFVEIDFTALVRRFFEILPGALSWGTLIGLSALAVLLPFWIAVFIIVFDVYILVRGVYMSVHLVAAYRRLRLMRGIDWLERCQKVSEDRIRYRAETAMKTAQAKAVGDRHRAWQFEQLLQHLEEMQSRQQTVMPWHRVHHAVLYPTYNESLSVLETSLNALRAASYPAKNLHVVVGFEDRVGTAARERAAALTARFSGDFATFLTTFHPDGLPGERRVKSANAAWAMQQLEKVLAAKGIGVDQVLVSNFDSDTVISPEYFAHLTYTFITHPDRYHVSYQPLPMYHNNLWDAPAFSRVIATGSTFWQMIESTRPERLVTFSSHSMTLRALKEVGYWHRDVISEDSRIFWQCLIHYNGRYRTEPLYTTVSMDAALAQSWWQTLVNQYKQKRRWGWGIENFPYFMVEFIRRSQMPLGTKFIYSLRTLEGHYSWATAAIIVAGLGWLPIFFGGPQFQATYLSYSLPYVARTIMTIAMTGLLISTILTLLLLPAKPARVSRWRYVPMVLQWALFPLIATVLSAFPALDAESRLMLGRDLEFNVMTKARREEEEEKI